MTPKARSIQLKLLDNVIRSDLESMPSSAEPSTARSTPVVVKGRAPAAAHDRVYAIGDIHGRADLFMLMLREIQSDARARQPNATTKIILLGDLIDRGPSSRDLLAIVQHFVKSDTGVVALRGNHEDMLLRAVKGSAVAQRAWLRNGGAETLRSFGLAPEKLNRLTPTERGHAISDGVGLATLSWLAALPTNFRSGDYFFCHAGIRPGVPLNRQKTSDLLWIGHEFINSDYRSEAVIVHGHTETQNAEFRPNRINVDTAAYRTGRLTAVGLEGAARWTLQVHAPTT